MRRIRTGKTEDRRMHTCPQCGKQRMSRPMDHEVSHEKREYETFAKTTVELFVDICDFCMFKNKREHFEPSQADLKKMLQALKDKEGSEDGPSIEDLL